MIRTARTAVTAWLQAAPLAAVFAVFFVIPLGLIVMVSFWQATDYELIPAFTAQSYLDVFHGCGDSLVTPGQDVCVTLKTYGSTLKFSLITWAVTAVLGFSIAYFLAFHIRSQLMQTVLLIVFVSSCVYFSWRLTLTVIVVAPVVGTLSAVFGRRLRNLARESLEGGQRMTDAAQEALVEETDWTYEDEFSHLKDEMRSVADQCRKDETKKMINIIEVCCLE